MILDFFQNQGKRGYHNALMKYWGNSIFVLFALCSPKIITYNLFALYNRPVCRYSNRPTNYYAQQKVIGLKQLWFILTLVKIYNFNIKTVTVFLNVEKNVTSKSFFYHPNVCIFDKSAVMSHNNLNFENLRCHNRDPVDAILH